MILKTCPKVLFEHLPGGTEESLENMIHLSRSLCWHSNLVHLCCVVNANNSVELLMLTTRLCFVMKGVNMLRCGSPKVKESIYILFQ